jgi:hypothetical protein
VQNHLLRSHPHARLAVSALWTDKRFWDSRAEWDTDGLTDRRVVHLWDGKDIAGDWFVNHLPTDQGGDWDAYLLFGPGAVWTRIPHPLLSSGSTVIGSSDQLQASILPLLKSNSHAGKERDTHLSLVV